MRDRTRPIVAASVRRCTAQRLHDAGGFALPERVSYTIPAAGKFFFLDRFRRKTPNARMPHNLRDPQGRRGRDLGGVPAPTLA